MLMQPSTQMLYRRQSHLSSWNARNPDAETPKGYKNVMAQITTRIYNWIGSSSSSGVPPLLSGPLLPRVTSWQLPSPFVS